MIMMKSKKIIIIIIITRGQAGGKHGASRGLGHLSEIRVMFFGCCAIIPPLKRTQNVAVAEATPQNQSAEDSRSPVRLGVAVYYSSSSKDVCAMLFSYVGTWDVW